MAMCLKNTNLVTQVPDSVDCSSSSCPTSASSDDSAPEGYLILTFDKTKKAKLKTAVFADVSDPRFVEDFDDDGIGEEEEGDFWPSNPGTSDGEKSACTETSSQVSNEPTKSTFNSCYGEAFWVGEDDVYDADMKPNPKIEGPVVEHKSVSDENFPDSQCLIRTSPLSHPYSSNISSTKSNDTHRNYTLSHLPLPLRLAKKYNHGFSTTRPGVYSRRSLVDVNSSLNEHSRKMLRCDECGKYYRNQYSLHHHICLRRKDVWKKGDVPSEVVDGQVIYFCPTCRKPFKWLGNLTRHFYVHTGQRFFRCDVCSKEFFSAYQVKRHMNSHTGLRYKCEVCEKPFTCIYACTWHTKQHFT